MSDQINLRVIRNFSEMEKIRGIWSSWRGHRDADIDVHATVLLSAGNSTEPYILLLERNGCPDALLVGARCCTEFSSRIGYVKLSTPSVRLLSFVNGAFLGNQAPENAEVMVSKILGSLREGEADVIHFSNIRTDSPLYRFTRKPPGFFGRNHFVKPTLHWTMVLPDTMDEVYARLSGDHRGQLRRKAKKLQTEFAGCLQVRRFQALSELEEMIKDAEEVAGKTYQRGLGVGFEKNETTLNLLQLEAEKGWLRGYVLYLIGKPCAFWVGSLYDGIFYSDFLAHDPAYEKYSPGTFLLTETIKNLCSEKVSEIDFGVGEARYKQQFGNRSREEAAAQLFAPRLKGMRLLLVTSGVLFMNRFLMGALERTNLLPKVKKILRRRATPKTKEGYS